MLRSIRATIEENGDIRLKEPVYLDGPHPAIVTIMEELVPPETALLSEEVLARDWNKPEEDEAWSHLQRVQ